MTIPVRTTPVLGALLLCLVSVRTLPSEQGVPDDIALGALAFSDNCEKCHQADGGGEQALYPSLHDPALLQDKTVLVQTILHGRTGPSAGEQHRPQPLMPSLDYLSNHEIAAIIAFISSSWGKTTLRVSESDVEAARRSMSKQDIGSKP